MSDLTVSQYSCHLKKRKKKSKSDTTCIVTCSPRCQQVVNCPLERGRELFHLKLSIGISVFVHPPQYFLTFLLCPSAAFRACSHSTCDSTEDGRRGNEEGRDLELKSFTAGLRSIYQHEDFSVRHLKSQLRTLPAAPVNKGRKNPT